MNYQFEKTREALDAFFQRTGGYTYEQVRDMDALEQREVANEMSIEMHGHSVRWPIGPDYTWLVAGASTPEPLIARGRIRTIEQVDADLTKIYHDAIEKSQSSEKVGRFFGNVSGSFKEAWHNTWAEVPEVTVDKE